MNGRKPKPTHLKIINGNPGKRPLNKAEPTFSRDLPEPPKWLPAGAKEYFVTVRNRIADMGYASASHTEALTLLASRLYQVEQCMIELEENGPVSVSDTNVAKTSPAALVLHTAAVHAQSLLVEFGLTPSSASRIIVPGKQKNNAFAKL
jgi:P27 family predicted phage terminase small subunit